MSVGSDDSMSSDLTLYYCLNCDTRHGLGSDDTTFVCSANYSSDEESIDNFTGTATWKVAHHQICAILNLVDRDEGERTPRAIRSALSWKRIEFDCQTSKQVSNDADTQPINPVSDIERHMVVHLVAIKVREDIDQGCLDFRKMMQGR
ncbi:hypothetical protein QYE76_005776 [Lolium multiflorum]|uniref:Uncharacterized protein n=1 Tax=Lolium multiflorum TaxID=4521 RepID=A0AAD8RTD5_LOLMU|nr:hypothetical protein QYE76_005776 [Lolium multiflorum]